LGQFTPSPPTIAGLSVSAPPGFLASASTVPEAKDAISLQEGGGSFYDGTLREVWINGYIINLYVSIIKEVYLVHKFIVTSYIITWIK
ncbi:hypothetical protein Taro_001327, partial [Colocasia esculenta]|nr:hypothetical protein [Colocasia esculenta]